MTHKEIATMVGTIGLPYAYYQFPGDTAVAPPFVCFFYPSSNDFMADGINYQKIEHMVIELYTDNKDFAMEATVENTLAENGIAWNRSESWIDSERMHVTVYEFDVLITSENEG